MKIGWVLFENYHQKENVGSSRIRGKWVIKKMKDAEEFVQGKKYDVIIFQKTYWKEMARAFKGIKILDICDPDWLDGAEIVNFSKDIDAITVPTEELKKDLEAMTNKPVYIIPDRVEKIQKKQHTGRAKTCVWFGYHHNSTVLDPALLRVKKNNLTLKIISNGVYRSTDCRIENIKWEPDTVDKEIRKADFALLPRFKKGRDIYKSDNKKIHAWSLGLPVATNPEEMDKFMDAKERNKEVKEKQALVKKEYLTTLSAKEYYDIIKEITKKR